jgi:hypothetical protein
VCILSKTFFIDADVKVCTISNNRLIVSSDRDEKIRLSHADRPYDIHAYLLAHTQAVRALAVMRQGVSWVYALMHSHSATIDGNDVVVSASLDCTVCVWWTSDEPPVTVRVPHEPRHIVVTDTDTPSRQVVITFEKSNKLCTFTVDTHTRYVGECVWSEVTQVETIWSVACVQRTDFLFVVTDRSVGWCWCNAFLVNLRMYCLRFYVISSNYTTHTVHLLNVCTLQPFEPSGVLTDDALVADVHACRDETPDLHKHITHDNLAQYFENKSQRQIRVERKRQRNALGDVAAVEARSSE